MKRCLCTLESAPADGNILDAKRAKIISEHWYEMAAVIPTEVVSWTVNNSQIRMLKYHANEISLRPKEGSLEELNGKLRSEGLRASDSVPVIKALNPAQVFFPAGQEPLYGTVPSFCALMSGVYPVVDKSRFIKYLSECGIKTHLISRPPGFGKTITLEMVESFFCKNSPGSFDPFPALFIGTELLQQKRKYRVLSLDLRKCSGTADFEKSLKDYLVSKLQFIQDIAADMTLFLVVEKFVTHLQGSEEEWILLIDNFDAPLLNYPNSMEIVDRVMLVAFSFISAFLNNLKYVIATCVIPENYNITFQNVDTAEKTKFHKSFGFENLETYLLLQKFHKNKVTHGTFNRFIDLYGNYYFSDTFTEQERCASLSHPNFVMAHLDRKEEVNAFKLMARYKSIRLLEDLLRKSPNISWLFESLKNTGCYHSKYNLDENYQYERNITNNICSLLRFNGLSNLLLAGYEFENPEEYEKCHHMLQVPNKAALSILNSDPFQSSEFSAVTSILMSGVLTGDATKIFKGIDMMVLFSDSTYLKWNTEEKIYQLCFNVLMLSVPSVSTRSEFSGSLGTPDFVITPRDPNIRTFFIIEFKILRKEIAESHKNDTNSTKVEEPLKTEAVNGFKQILMKRYASILEKLKAEIKDFHPEKVVLMAVAFFRRQFVGCYSTEVAEEAKNLKKTTVTVIRSASNVTSEQEVSIEKST